MANIDHRKSDACRLATGLGTLVSGLWSSWPSDLIEVNGDLIGDPSNVRSPTGARESARRTSTTMIIDFHLHDGLGRRRAHSPEGDLAARGGAASINRIEALNPRLNAVVHTRCSTARSTTPTATSPTGRFAACPSSSRTSFRWYEGEPTTSGSRLFKGWIAPYDSEMVRRYKRAGLIVVGKTNTPEFGLVPFTESELLGTCRNPWNPGRHRRRLVRRFRRRGGERHGAPGGRRRWRRIDPHSRIVLRTVRTQADARPHANRARCRASCGAARRWSTCSRAVCATAPRCSTPSPVPMWARRISRHRLSASLPRGGQDATRPSQDRVHHRTDARPDRASRLRRRR